MKRIFDIRDGDSFHEWYDIPDTPFLIRMRGYFCVVHRVIREIRVGATPYRQATMEYFRREEKELTEDLNKRFAGSIANANLMHQIGRFLQHYIMNDLARQQVDHWLIDDFKADWVDMKRRVIGYDDHNYADDAYADRMRKELQRELERRLLTTRGGLYNDVFECPPGVDMKMLGPAVPYPKINKLVYHWHAPAYGGALHALEDKPCYWRGTDTKAMCGVEARFVSKRGLNARRCAACCKKTNTPEGIGVP